MHPITRFRPGFGFAFIGLAVLTACGQKEGQQEAPKLIRPGLAAASAPAAPEPTADQPGLPVVHIQADALVTTGTGGHEATVSGDPGLQYQWFIQGGSFDGDIHGSSVNWTAGAPGEVRLFCQGTNAAGKKTVTLARVQSEALPTIDRFEATPAVISLGHSARLGWNAKEIKSLLLDPGGKDVTQVSGPALEVKPVETTQYTLTATNAAGATVSRTAQVKVVPPPAISAFRGQGAVNFGQALNLVAEFSGGKAELKQGGTLLASGDTSPLQATVPALKTGDSFTLTVTNEAGDGLTRTINFNPPSNEIAAPK